MNQFATLRGVAFYEFRMQIRRRAVWIPFVTLAIVLGVLILLLAPTSGRDALLHLSRFSIKAVVVNWTNELNSILPIFVGVLLADRLTRDRKHRVEELQISSPSTLSIRLIGKYLGSTLATLSPVLILYIVGITYILVETDNPLTLPLALATFASVILPGMLFVAAFSIACPAIIWVPVYQFLFVGYWFWGNLFPPGTAIPTLSNTILTPIGGFPASAFFGADFLANTSNQIPAATITQAVESIILLLAIAVLVLVALWGLLKWQLAHR